MTPLNEIQIYFNNLKIVTFFVGQGYFIIKIDT